MTTTPSPDLAAFKQALASLDPAQVKTMIERVHPEYAANLAQWNFLEATYEGGRHWFPNNVFRYIKEGEIEYKERLDRAYRFNHTREVVDLVNKYIFKGQIIRKDVDASASVQNMWKTTTLNRRPITDFMKLVSKGTSTFGRIWVCADSNQSAPNATIVQEKLDGSRVYAYTIKPQNVLDIGYSNDGDLTWAKVREVFRDDSDVLSSGTLAVRYRVWTQQFWAVFNEEIDEEKHETIYVLGEVGEHGLGRVPLFPVDHTPSDNIYVTTGLIDDIAYLDRAVANYLSNLDVIIQDQTFSQLVMPAQSMLPGDDSQTKILELGVKRIFTYDASGGLPPSYISPDASNATLLLSVINKIISEIYHSIGMAGERTKQDNSMGIDNSSGVAKAFDFDRMNAMLASKARSLELAENTLCELTDTWFGTVVVPGSYGLVTYPDNFDVRGLYDEIDLAEQLLLIQAPDGVRQQQMLMVIDKLFTALPSALIAKMKAEVQSSWPPVEVAPANQPPSAVAQETSQGGAKTKKATPKS